MTAVGGGGSVGGNFGTSSSSSGAARERPSNAPRLENLSSAKAPSDEVSKKHVLIDLHVIDSIAAIQTVN